MKILETLRSQIEASDSRYLPHILRELDHAGAILQNLPTCIIHTGNPGSMTLLRAGFRIDRRALEPGNLIERVTNEDHDWFIERHPEIATDVLGYQVCRFFNDAGPSMAAIKGDFLLQFQDELSIKNLGMDLVTGATRNYVIDWAFSVIDVRQLAPHRVDGVWSPFVELNCGPIYGKVG